MKLTVIILTLIAFSTTSASAQQEFFIKKRKSGRLKKLKSTTNFGFEILGSGKSKATGYFGRVIQMTDSTVTIEEYVKPSMRHAVSRSTQTINIRDIKSIKNYLIDNEDFNTFGGMMIFGGILGLVATPIVWIAEGQEDGIDGAIFTGTLFGVGALLLLPQHIGKRKQMSKWEFVKK